MKRFRVLRMDFDTRANMLGIEISPTWDPRVQEMHRKNKAMIIEWLAAQYGQIEHAAKVKNFLDLGAAPFSVVAFHNRFYRQARDAFVAGAYYPALTGVCALGERVLNHLVLSMREDYAHTPEYRRVYRKDSFDDWHVAIDALLRWSVLLPRTAELFRKLRGVRHRAIHFDPTVEASAREMALKALKLFEGIVDEQFAAWDRPWYIQNDIGIAFVRKDHESVPFVARVVLPSCVLVGPGHDLEKKDDGEWAVIDPHEYTDCQVSDEEFIRLFKGYPRGKTG
jgi:hypothetical protein